MNLHGLRVRTSTDPTAEICRCFGGQSLIDGVSPGDGNTVHVLMRQSSGSGPRANLYTDRTTPSGVGLGVGNRLEIVGNARAFNRTNDDFVPAPPAEFFTAER